MSNKIKLGLVALVLAVIASAAFTREDVCAVDDACRLHRSHD